METAQAPSKRNKIRFHGKVRTGCLTCKKRKLKCDEQKPHCRRCTGTGRECEGYRSDRQSPTTPNATSPAPHSGLFASDAERRSFFYFQSKACKPLGGYFNSSFWGREVLRAAIHFPPIRHLVIALGAAYEDYEAGTRGQGTQLALQQCNNSIKSLTALTQGTGSLSADATCCVLTASLLFVYLASIRGQFSEALQHVKAAIKVLHSFERSLQQQDGAPRTSYPVPLAQLRALLLSVYGQLRAIFNDVYLEAESPDILASDLKPATIFTSVQDAHAYAETLTHNTLAFLQAVDVRSHPTTEDLEADVARHKQLCQALESSRNALDVLVQGLSKPGDAQEEEGIVVIRIHHLILAIRLRIDIFRPHEREAAFDGLEDHLEEILRHCEFLIRRHEEGKETLKQASCSSGLGYVMPLHMVAARCRNPRLRRRAVELLLACSRREGLWDSHLAGKIVSQTIALEEQAMCSSPSEDGKVSGDQRVREVKLEFHPDNTAAVRLVTVDDWKYGRPGMPRLVEW